MILCYLKKLFQLLLFFRRRPAFKNKGRIRTQQLFLVFRLAGKGEHSISRQLQRIPPRSCRSYLLSAFLNCALKLPKLVLKLLKEGTLGSPEEDGYISRGVRKNCFHDMPGADRAVAMLVKKLKGEEFTTEYPMPVFDRVDPAAAITDMKNATIALVTSGGIVPKGNPDHIESSSASKFGRYCIADVATADSEHYATAHGGYDPTYANHDPN